MSGQQGAGWPGPGCTGGSAGRSGGAGGGGFGLRRRPGRLGVGHAGTSGRRGGGGDAGTPAAEHLGPEGGGLAQAEHDHDDRLEQQRRLGRARRSCTTVMSSVWMSSAPSTRAGDGEPAAGQRRAADHHREDGVQLDQVAGRVAVGAGDVGAVDQAGDAGAQRRRTRTTMIDQPRGPGCRPAGWRSGCRRPTRAADPARCAGSAATVSGHHGRGDQHGDRQREAVAGADHPVRRRADVDDLAVGDQLGDARARPPSGSASR